MEINGNDEMEWNESIGVEWIGVSVIEVVEKKREMGMDA